ncbi:MAG: protein-L-isoaspartate(D-aspartate) O-methyltransferase [Acidobacteria bacterium]|nr:protein-L-isoaspartate(D-aspartate) O-methyltransferase [Acidobacteriota bacterium]
MSDLQRERERMVETQIAARGVRDPGVLRAMRSVPREEFVPEELRSHAYSDGPLPIGSGQTISQPFIVASMVQSLELKGDDRVLEIGVGSGYAAAVIAEIVDEVYGIERHEELATTAGERLKRLGYDNVEICHGDGTRGWEKKAPFDAIVVAAAGPKIPDSLKDQLAIGGRMVIPVGSTAYDQSLVRITRTETGFEQEKLEAVRFVPLVGEEGWPEKE